MVTDVIAKSFIDGGTPAVKPQTAVITSVSMASFILFQIRVRPVCLTVTLATNIIPL